ncbi:hypothetical protein MUP06_02190 [Patescibacteria group bacterium]|nr:hypothetical protein [Patescibacteria group bacterium]
MSIFEKKQELSGAGPKKNPTPPSKSKTRFEEKDTTIFGEKKAISMREATWKIRKDPHPYIPGSGGAMFSEKERMDIAKRLSKYGSYLEKGPEHSRIFKELYKEKTKARTGAEKLKIDREIRYLKEKLGK